MKNCQFSFALCLKELGTTKGFFDSKYEMKLDLEEAPLISKIWKNFSFTKLFMDFPPSASNNVMVTHVPWVSPMLSSIFPCKKVEESYQQGS